MVAPFGSWPSPITAESLTARSVSLGEAVVDGDRLIWAEARPERGGRISLMRRDLAHPDSEPVELIGDPYSVRSRVQEYGGGAWAVAGDVLVFSDFTDNRVHRVDLGDLSIEPITVAKPKLRYGALRIDPSTGSVLAVREDHRPDGEAETTVVSIPLDGSDTTGGDVLCRGADFYADPTLSADGRLAWVEWDHPNMPWDDTRLLVADLAGLRDGSQQGQRVAGGSHESVARPLWLPDGRLLFVSDRTDWWNLYFWDAADGADDAVSAVCPTEAEFGLPAWVQGDHPFALRSADELICMINDQNVHRLVEVQLSTGRLTPIPTEAVAIGSLHTDGRRLVTTLGYRDRPRTLSVLDLSAGHWTDLGSSSSLELPAELISVAEGVSWTSAAGEVHGWFYPPTNREVDAPADERPPMITISHGGPTSGSTPVYNLDIQYWTSRGIAVLDVNYSGSTGYGRPYRERLRQQWGVLDVGDCIDGTLAMAAAGRADEARLAIRGGSAGGYTTLRALTSSTVFGAGISLYGIGDLEALASDSHKFESRYLDSMVGPYPQDADVYRDRSPIHHLDQLSAPILLLQGADDAVVPPNQAEMFAAAARQAGLPVAMIIFEGEGHGFRQPANVRAALEASLYFLGRVFGFTPADDLPGIEIDNLNR